ncbi:CGNR zinc finger domain-containing protein [Streptoalloteichus hindustanus]|uniref:Conserved protein containing a Zn-ribbon-like motif, possibly RNA-binding n=1 Tax=Streptoalloteichus hindustanus TaxID=2017 RepID=A0A1M5PUJ8_STRHI|nr:CGNR zinc finger domain-containing protein [Streptoalloteichus hindustanus]SHH05488.1 Conserved protein containing a Zn-ribbon-like motif, possibly RNA-binding [Streptoalloteichus hindustanus]
MGKEDALAFRFDCGAVWLNLLATRGRTFSANPVERLSTPERLGEWLEHCELTPTRAPNEEDLRQTWRLREALRALALSTMDQTPPPADAAAELETFLSGHSSAIRFTVDDRLRREPPATVGDALARIAHQAVDHLTSADRHALKSCPEHDCRGVFVDSAGRRRWCPSPTCASRGRVRALRARRTAAAPDKSDLR